MWHAFDIIAEELAVDAGLRGIRAGAGHRIVYGERVVRWFTDKSGQGQWPAVVDRQPGISLERPVASSAMAGTWTLVVEHTRRQTVPDTLRMTMTCAPDAWRSPQQWQAMQTLGDAKQPSPLGETYETAQLTANRIRRMFKAGANSIHESFDAMHPTSVYSLLADFPAKELASDQPQPLASDAFFTEGMLFVGSGRITRGATGGPDQHPLAAGLRCFTLTPAMGFPFEFWVNDAGTVVYLIEAATRAWVLERVEALT